MATRRVDGDSSPKKRRGRPATTPEDREQQMINYAYDLAEQQMLNGTAPAPTVNHFLKLGGARAAMELEALRRENLLREEKIAQMKASVGSEEMLREAMRVFTGDYQGREPSAHDDYLS